MGNRRKYRNYLIIITFVVLIFSLFYGSNQLINLYIPNEMKLIVDKEEDFQFNLPLEANFESKQKVLKVNESNVPQDQIKLSLNEPFSLLSSEIGQFDVELKLFGLIPIKKVKVNVIEEQELIPAGLTVGVIVSTEGVMVLGTGVVRGEDGVNYEPSEDKLKSGDYIISVNGTPIYSKEELVQLINENGENLLHLTVKRGDKEFQVEMTPVKGIGVNEYKIGIWVRDDTQGIGTITYIDPDKEVFGALGHGITDADTQQLIAVNGGEILKTQITAITKGQKGAPGEIAGIIVDDQDSHLGKVNKNTKYGIFGEVNTSLYDLVENQPISIGLKHEVKTGVAHILSCVDGDIKEYEIEIEQVYLGDGNMNKGMIIEVTDPRLLKQTNGIVQGMSGSPIIQNNKIIGAVTHVFVQDSTKGYGTFIENMLISSDE